jgi:hypothetical protein
LEQKIQWRLMADSVSSQKFREPAFRKAAVYIKGRFVASSRMCTIGQLRTVANVLQTGR